MRTLLLASLLLVGCASVAEQKPLFAGKLVTLPAFDENYVPARTVRVWTPPKYPREAPYDVLYMHDGQMLFDATSTWNGQEWGVDETATALIATGKTRPYIVVALDNGDARRHTEYFPEKPWQSLPEGKRAEYLALQRDPTTKLFVDGVDSDNYLRFIVEQLKPYVDENFTVALTPEHTFIAGSSMGGLISIYALSEYPDVFGGAACLSTHWLGTFSPTDNPIPQSFADYLRNQLPTPGRHKIYFDHGDQDLDSYYPPHQKTVDAVMTELGFSTEDWQTRAFPVENHSENAWQRRLRIPLTFLMGIED